MKNIKRFLMLAVMFCIFVVGTGVLLSQYKGYRKAYRELGRIITHTSIEPDASVAEEGSK